MNKAKHRTESILLAFLFIIYFIMLFKITIFRDTSSGVHRFNLIPFSTIAEYFKTLLSGIRVMGIANLLGNLIIFFPLGYMTASLFPKMRKLKKMLLLVFGFSVAIEIVQYILACGAADIDDVILNTLGGIVGYAVYSLGSKTIKTKKYVIILSTFVIVVTCVGFYSFDSYKFLVDRSKRSELPALTNTLPKNSSESLAIDEQPSVYSFDDRSTNVVNSDEHKNISIDIMATNAFVLNVDTNSVLFQKNSNEHIAPASTAKMLTALTVLDYCSLDDVFIVSSEIDLIASDSSRAGLNIGDTLTVKQLLVALLLPSGNDAAFTFAVNTGKMIAGSDDINEKQAIKMFVDAMNQKAKELGAASSNFLTPDGYDADGQYTTAFDLAIIAIACLNNDTLLEIMGSYRISDTWMNGREITYRNTNELINPDSQYYYSAVIGLKTGSTKDAGSCLVSAAYINGQTYICVVMGSTAEIRFLDSLAVFNAIDPSISLPQINNTTPAAHPGELRKR